MTGKTDSRLWIDDIPIVRGRNLIKDNINKPRVPKRCFDLLCVLESVRDVILTMNESDRASYLSKTAVSMERPHTANVQEMGKITFDSTAPDSGRRFSKIPTERW